MFDGTRLTEVIPWAHQFLAAVLWPGSPVVDLTAGTGRDTLFLFRKVGPSGRILAFDIQEAALLRTRDRLEPAGAPVRRHKSADGRPTAAGVHLIHDCHSRLDDYLGEAPRAVIANLGYLPGGDAAVRTEPDSTLAALETALTRLAPGGRIAVVAYVGHSGGAEEAAAVESRFRCLPSGLWQVLRLEAANRSRAPFVLLAQKSGRGVA